MSPGLLAVAHRAGNDPAALRTALDSGVDLVEADIHSFRARLEVRHHKALGPRWLWEPGELVRRDAATPGELCDLLESTQGDPRLLLDLKGVNPRLAGRVAATIAEVAPATALTVCTQHWWMLDAFGRLPNVRTVLSAGSRRGLYRLRGRLHGGPVYGVCAHRRLLTRDLVAELRRRASVVLTWPVDTPDALSHAHRLGVGGVISKDDGVLNAVMAGRRA